MIDVFFSPLLFTLPMNDLSMPQLGTKLISPTLLKIASPSLTLRNRLRKFIWHNPLKT